MLDLFAKMNLNEEWITSCDVHENFLGSLYTAVVLKGSFEIIFEPAHYLCSYFV